MLEKQNIMANKHNKMRMKTKKTEEVDVPKCRNVKNDESEPLLSHEVPVKTSTQISTNKPVHLEFFG